MAFAFSLTPSRSRKDPARDTLALTYDEKSLMHDESPTEDALHFWLWAIAIAAAYIISGKIGLQFAFLNQSATPIWAPTGIAIATLLFRDKRYWFVIFVSAYIVNLTTTSDFLTSAFIAAGNTFEGFIGAYLVRCFAGGKKTFDSVDNFLRYSLSVSFACACSATIGLTSLAAFGFADWSTYVYVWTIWWIGDMVGAIVVTPFIFSWSRPGVIIWNRTKFIEAIFVALLGFFLWYLSLSGFTAYSRENYPLSYLLLIPLVFAAARFYRRGVTTTLLLLCMASLVATFHGYGPFVFSSVDTSLLMLQLFFGAAGFMSIALAAASFQNIQATEKLQRNENTFRSMVELLPHNVCVLSRDGIILYATEAATKMLGHPLEMFIESNVLAIVHPHDYECMCDVLGSSKEQSPFIFSARCQCADGSWKILEWIARDISRESGMDGYLCTFREKTELPV